MYIQSVIALVTLAALTFSSVRSEAQQKDLGEVNILTAMSNMAFSALWVAKQLKYSNKKAYAPKSRQAAAARHAERSRRSLRRTFTL